MSENSVVRDSHVHLEIERYVGEDMTSRREQEQECDVEVLDVTPLQSPMICEKRM